MAIQLAPRILSSLVGTGWQQRTCHQALTASLRRCQASLWGRMQEHWHGGRLVPCPNILSASWPFAAASMPRLLGGHLPDGLLLPRLAVAVPAATLNQPPVAEQVETAGAATSLARELFSAWADFLRPKKFSMRLDVKMKRGAAPYPRNPNRKKPVPKVKGIIRKLLD
eukprot:TRINITY_DN94941_c0_g1_i1.p1 TRINITY_DN94941_c0_g1~~TRINITY_DN94941_c0_g1_i1.p1  ORF type:complete len:168 (-),score=27.39 TRINITY_DN94941_c0_g1_i1:79-582(-)